MKTKDKIIRTHIGMKFLLTVGICSTVFCVFQFYQMWSVSKGHAERLFESKTRLALAFYQAIQLHVIEPHLAQNETDILNRVQAAYPGCLFRYDPFPSEEPMLVPLFALFSLNTELNAWSGQQVIGGCPYFVRVAPRRDPQGDMTGLDMVAFPIGEIQTAMNDEVLGKMQSMMLALLGLFAAVYVSFELLAGRRIRRIAEHFGRFTTEKEYVRIDPIEAKGRDEIGLLVYSFNELAARRNGMYQRLEEIVNERTAELEETNRQLKHQIQYSRQAEEQANVLASEARAANTAKSEFLANMSHEIRTPMNAIMGFGEILAEEIVSDTQRGYVRLILNSSRNLLAIINDILDYSKIEAGRMTLEITDCDLGQMLHEIDSMLRPGSRKKQLAFEVLQCGQLPQYIKTDPVRLRQCLINLLSNAIKFTEQGHVFMNVSMQQVDNLEFVRFDVEDTGIGIPSDKQVMIFDSFSQADSATTRKYGGTGLGLAITKRLAELLGGHVFLESHEGKGSIFSLAIPAPAGWREESSCNKYQAIDDSTLMIDEVKGTIMSGKILVAEDNPSNQKLISILLQKMGVEVTIADDGRMAMDKALAEKFDLILMDMQMPTMNGYDATRELRNKGCKTPIIAVTANAMMGDEDKCLKAGCDGYLSKPIDRTKLAEVVGRYIPMHV